ncbi:MAG: YncE family protein [Phycisphaerales bacterium]
MTMRPRWQPLLSLTRVTAAAAGLLLVASAALHARLGGGGAGSSVYVPPPEGLPTPHREAISPDAGDGVAQALNQPAPLAAFANFESPHIHPLDVTPDGSKLLAVNTADGRLEVFDITLGVPVGLGSVSVGVDPVSVRARTNTEAWVVNHISDSVSVVDLTTMNVTRSLKVDDEPADVVFAGPPGTTRAFVSCSQANTVLVFDPANLALLPTRIAINGDRPRALAVSPDGLKVYAAIFESGNNTTVLGGGIAISGTLAFPPNAVSDAAGPYAGVNPPPNAGAAFEPARSADASVNLPSGLIVRKNAAGQWMDDNNHDWTSIVSGANAAKSGRPLGWTLSDNDVAMIDAGTLAVSYANGLMNLCMSLAVNPATGLVSVVGTEATNQVRFEPRVNGTFVRVVHARFDPASPAATTSIGDLNPHLDYSVSTLPQVQRDLSLGDPRQMVWEPAGTRAWVAGMGSNNIVAVDTAGQRVAGPIDVGEGPTGLALGPAGRLFVLNRFAGTLAVIDTVSDAVITSVPFFDPTPTAIKVGRKHLYDTHKNSGLGQAACASCHIDAKMDRLAWDLGDPSGANAPLTDRNLGFGVLGLAPPFAAPAFEPFHPMKGVMTTQTLQDIIGNEPHHWRGDRRGIEEFNGAFLGLQGDDTNLTSQEMQEFEDYLATIIFPPNPFRNFDNTLPANLPLPGHFRTGRFGNAGQPLPNGSASSGQTLYRSTSRRLDGGAFACVTCHTLPTGMGPDGAWTGVSFAPFAVGPSGEHHLGLVSVDGSTNISIKVPQLRNMYKKVGFDATQTTNRAGFGFLHDGSVDSIARFIAEPAFIVNNDQEVADLVAFMLCLSGSDLIGGSPTNQQVLPGPPSKDARASVGRQITFFDQAPDFNSTTLLGQMVTQAAAAKVGLIAKARTGNASRGFHYNAGLFRSDRATETFTQAQLLALAGPGSEVTFTVVKSGTQIRLGVDRDGDGFFDRNELDVCSDPADAASVPGGPGNLDYNRDFNINPDDVGDFITDYFTLPPLPGPGGYAIACPENDPPYATGYKAAYISGGSGQCHEPYPDNLGDYITDYFLGACGS